MHKKAEAQAPEERIPMNVRCKAPHLIKTILEYSPKKERADSIEDESEVQQCHFYPPPFSRSRTWTLPPIQIPNSNQLALIYKGLKCRYIDIKYRIVVLHNVYFSSPRYPLHYVVECSSQPLRRGTFPFN